MSAIHDRSELLEPLLLAEPLRGRAAFEDSATERCRADIVRRLRLEHVLTEAAVAAGLESTNVDGDDLSEREPLWRAIRDDADRWLTPNGDHWSLTVDSRKPGREIVRWRATTMLLPPSIVVAGALVKHGLVRPLRVQALPDCVAPQHEVGHLHVHLGPMLPFEAIWSELWAAFVVNSSLDPSSDTAEKSIALIDGCALPEIASRSPWKRAPGRQWQWLLELAMLARAWMVGALDDQAEGTTLAPEPWRGGGGSPSLCALRALARGTTDINVRRGALAEARATPAVRRFARLELRARQVQNREELRRSRRRCVACCLPGRCGCPGAAVHVTRPDPEACVDLELEFLVRALGRCRAEAEWKAAFFTKLFYQYLRIKVALYRVLVVDPWATGLRHFLDVVVRDAPYTEVAASEPRLRDRRLTAARHEPPLRVSRVEIHTALKSWLKEDPRREVDHAWIVAFPRSRKQSENSEGEKGALKWRSTEREQDGYARAVARRLEARPRLLRQVRGVTLMDWERNGPLWLFEKSLRHLLGASQEVAARNPALDLQPLRTAIHLGEDFDHLLSGLRQIYEPFAWEVISRGDRIGHALALGLDVDEWERRNESVRVRPWDRLLDIGFVAWAIANRGLSVDGESVNRLRASALEATTTMFGDCRWDPLEAARHVWLALPVSRPPSASPTADTIMSWARDRINEILDDRVISPRALSRTMVVEPKREVSVLRTVHKFVHDRVAAMQVGIEVNPSSNLLVGGFRAIFEQPVFHFENLPLLLSADDPLTFATTLADDYAYAWAGMILPGKVTPAEATNRLVEAARNSVRYAFAGPTLRGG